MFMHAKNAKTIRAQLKRFYRKHNTAKLVDVDRIVSVYKNHYDILNCQLQEKYNERLFDFPIDEDDDEEDENTAGKKEDENREHKMHEKDEWFIIDKSMYKEKCE